MQDHVAFDFCAFWRRLTGEYAYNMEGENPPIFITLQLGTSKNFLLTPFFVEVIVPVIPL